MLAVGLVVQLSVAALLAAPLLLTAAQLLLPPAAARRWWARQSWRMASRCFSG